MIEAKTGAREVTLNIVVTKADGSVEDHGEVAYWHKNPLRRWLRPIVRSIPWRRS